MTDLYNDVDVLGAIMSDLISDDIMNARSKLQTLLTEKGRELANMEAYYDELAKQYEDGIGEGQAA